MNTLKVEQEELGDVTDYCSFFNDSMTIFRQMILIVLLK